MRRLRQLSLSVTKRRTQSTSALEQDSGGDPGSNRDETSGPPLIHNLHSPVIEDPQSLDTSISKRKAVSITASMDSNMSCGDTTTEGTNTTSSRTEDDGFDPTDEKDKKQNSDFTLIESIQQLDALLSGKTHSSKSRPSIDSRQQSMPEDQPTGKMRARRASTGGAVCACEITAKSMDGPFHRPTADMSDAAGTKFLRRLSGEYCRTAGDAPLISSTTNSNNPIPDQATRWSRFTPTKKAIALIRHKSIRIMRRYSVNHYRSSGDHMQELPLHIATNSNGDAPSDQEIALQLARGEARDSSIDRSEDWLGPATNASVPMKFSEEQALTCEDRGSVESDSDDAASDVVHYNTDEDVYNARRHALSPKRTAKMPTPSQRVSLMNLMPRSASPLRPRSIRSLPAPRHGCESEESDYDDDTITSVSDLSGADDLCIEFDAFEMSGNRNTPSSCVTPDSSRRRRARGPAPANFNRSFHSDLSSEVEESLKDSVIARRHSSVRLSMRVAPRRTSLGTATSASSEPDDSVADSIADRHHSASQPRGRHQAAPTGTEAIGWEPTFVSPIKENHRRRLSLSNIPNSLNDGSRGLPRFNSMRMMLSDESEDTFMVEEDDTSGA